MLNTNYFFTAWTSWSKCSRACNAVGRIYKTRQIKSWERYGGTKCDGRLMEDSQPCVGPWPCSGPTNTCTDFKKPGTPVCYCKNGFYKGKYLKNSLFI